MHIAFLGSEASWYLRDLRRAAGDQFTIESVSFNSIASTIEGDRIAVHQHRALVRDTRLSNLDRYDAVLVRTMPPGSLEQIVFRMDALASLEARGTLVVNPPKAIEAAVDKYLTTSRLACAGLLVPRTITCQTAEAAMDAFSALGEDVVVKPIFGGEGRGITRLEDKALALRAFKLIEQLGGIIYLQEFIEHEGYDIRVLLVGDKVFAMQRRNQLDWRTNIARGAKAESYDPTPAEVDLACRAAEAVSAPLAGVDLLPGRDGRLYAVEVNAVPGWRALARATGEDVAEVVLNWLSVS
ncbi:MAG: ATP-grasp domain-containing protein [Aeoliella sp.]